MIEFKTGNIFDSNAQVLVCPVNCVGVMGAGLAKEFDKKIMIYHSNCMNVELLHDKHKELCDKGELCVGKPVLVDVGNDKIPNVMMFPTKNDWRKPSEITYIEFGLENFIIGFQSYTIHDEKIPYKSFAFPKLGCGLGGLDWKDVKPLMLKYLDTEYINNLGITIEIWE